MCEDYPSSHRTERGDSGTKKSGFSAWVCDLNIYQSDNLRKQGFSAAQVCQPLYFICALSGVYEL